MLIEMVLLLAVTFNIHLRRFLSTHEAAVVTRTLGGMVFIMRSCRPKKYPGYQAPGMFLGPDEPHENNRSPECTLDHPVVTGCFMRGGGENQSSRARPFRGTFVPVIDQLGIVSEIHLFNT